MNWWLVHKVCVCWAIAVWTTVCTMHLTNSRALVTTDYVI